MCIRSIYPRMLVRISGHSCRPLSLAMCKQSKKFPYFFHQSPLVTCWHWTSNSIKSLLITSFHCFQSKTFKTWWYFHLGFGGGEKIDNWSLKLNIIPGNHFVFTVQVFECLLMSSVMSCAPWDVQEKFSENVKSNPMMRFLHREGTGHCGTECLEYTTKRRWDSRGDKTDGYREGTVYMAVL